MKEKALDVLSYLNNQADWTTASEISLAVGASVRSVKSYVAELNAACPELIASSRKGFLLEHREKAFQLLNEQDTAIPQTPEGRKSYIMQKLLIENQTYDLDTLADELCISPLTLNNEIARFKKELIPYDLVFHTKNNQIWIEGIEKNKKKMISHMIYENTKDFCCNIDMIQNYLPEFDLRIVRQIVTTKIMAHHFFIDDFSLLNFILHIGITMERSKSQPHLYDSAVPFSSLEEAALPAHICTLMEDISSEIERYFQIQFHTAEQYDLALLLMTRLIRETEPESVSSLTNLVPSDVQDLVELIQNRVRSTFHLNLNNPDFLIRFTLHIKNLLIRLENQIDLKNPQLYSIKNSYPFIYDVSVFIANIISQEKGVLLSEDEIAYIALHIGVLIEEQRSLRDKVKILIICPQYYDNKLNLVKKIGAMFDDVIIINGVLTGPEDLPLYRDYDLILSTLPVSPRPATPLVLVPYHLRNSDIIAISEALEQIKKSRMKRILEQKLKFLFYPELFFYEPAFRTAESALSSMADQLREHHFVGDDYKTRLFAREKISPCAFGNIAMPHPMEMCSEKTAIAVAIYPGSIPWNTNFVNLVLMLAINEEDRPLFQDIFDFVTDVISDPKHLQALMNTRTYEDFIQLLVSLS